jgi:hypothetical protein
VTAEVRELLSYLGAFGVGAVIAGFVVFFLLKSFLPSYLAEKGKNLATREDIAEITDKIEKVKSEYALILEELKAHHQLRLAALDRRLAAHQEAFVLWRELMRTVHTEDVGKTVMKCQDWWEKNCLYLSETVRESFSDAYSAAHAHHAYVQSRTDAKLVQENWARIVKAGNDIVAAVQLPGLTTAERAEIKQLQEKSAK